MTDKAVFELQRLVDSVLWPVGFLITSHEPAILVALPRGAEGGGERKPVQLVPG